MFLWINNDLGLCLTARKLYCGQSAIEDLGAREMLAIVAMKKRPMAHVTAEATCALPWLECKPVNLNSIGRMAGLFCGDLAKCWNDPAFVWIDHDFAISVAIFQSGASSFASFWNSAFHPVQDHSGDYP